jgi:hypothetical protein
MVDIFPRGWIAIFMTDYRARRARSTMEAFTFGVRRLDGALFDSGRGDD